MVEDASRRPPRPRPLDRTRPGGFGWPLVHALALDVHVSIGQHETVSAVLPRDVLTTIWLTPKVIAVFRAGTGRGTSLARRFGEEVAGGVVLAGFGDAPSLSPEERAAPMAAETPNTMTAPVASSALRDGRCRAPGASGACHRRETFRPGPGD
ncbi:hypothetical protein ACWD00_40730 [Streptomyces viridiviolaceus]